MILAAKKLLRSVGLSILVTGLLFTGPLDAKPKTTAVAAKSAPSSGKPGPSRPREAKRVLQPAASSAVPASALNPKPREFAPREASPPTKPTATLGLGDLMSQVAALRSRLATLTSALFDSRMRVELQLGGEDSQVKSLSITLDGGVIYVAPKQSFFVEPQVVYEHAVSPGTHVLGIEIERQARADTRYSTWQSSRFVVVVPDKQLLSTRLELEAEGDLAEEGEGGSELVVRLQVEVGE